MTNADNDNEKLSFITLAAATANVARYLDPHKKQDEKRREDRGAGDAEEQQRKEHREYVEQRLREIEGFERRANGDQPPPKGIWRRRGT